jgi:hypothetical protein
MKASALWRKLDAPGHDACRLRQLADGWELDGTSVFLSNGTAARVNYQIVCDASWRTRHGHVQGWIGERDYDIVVVRTEKGRWELNNVAVPGLEGCLDLDYGFTPATNFLQLRRVALREREAADVPVVWLNTPADKPELLHQRYERRSQLTYWYEAPTVGYAGLLEMSAEGFISRYPGLWEMER